MVCKRSGFATPGQAYTVMYDVHLLPFREGTLSHHNERISVRQHRKTRKTQPRTNEHISWGSPKKQRFRTIPTTISPNTSRKTNRQAKINIVLEAVPKTPKTSKPTGQEVSVYLEEVPEKAKIWIYAKGHVSESPKRTMPRLAKKWAYFSRESRKPRKSTIYKESIFLETVPNNPKIHKPRNEHISRDSPKSAE